MRHQLQELLGARLDWEIQNEHENVRTFLFYLLHEQERNKKDRLPGISNALLDFLELFDVCSSVCLCVCFMNVWSNFSFVGMEFCLGHIFL